MRRLLIVALMLILAGLDASAGAASKTTKHKHTQAGPVPNAVPAEALAAMKTIDAERIRAHVKFLADDLLEGRGTGQRGGDLAAAYIATQFALDGLKPAGATAVICSRYRWSGSAPSPRPLLSSCPTRATPCPAAS